MAKQKLPTTFIEGHRNYSFDIFQPGGLAGGAGTIAGCIRTMTYAREGTVFEVVARYRESAIGSARYIKRGPSGQVTTVETVEASGAMVGLMEAELAKRSQELQAKEDAKRAQRLVKLQCPSCGSWVFYDPQEGCFAATTGEVSGTCGTCSAALDLAEVKKGYQQRIARLQDDLKKEQEGLARLLKFVEGPQG